MYLLLIVLQALCELVSGGNLAPQLEPVRRAPEEPDGSAGREKRRSEPSLCSVFDASPPWVSRQTTSFPQLNAALRCALFRAGPTLRWRRRF
jgi:hypothetical protein